MHRMHKVLLIDDQEIIAEAVKDMLQGESDIAFYYCQNPLKALETAQEVHPTVILQDLVMPDMDGLSLLKVLRAHRLTKDIPTIVLSSKEEPLIKAESFSLGANDYLVKIPDKIELLARIRYHSDAYHQFLERHEAFIKLQKSEGKLSEDLTSAADYVKALLPLPLKDRVKTAYCYHPSTQVGGDAFGYQWLDSEHFAFYLLDVCGHGAGTALLSISIMNVLKSANLLHADFKNPAEVLSALNASFQMDQQHQLFFSLWYGVFCLRDRNITYASAGHPPAVLFQFDRQEKQVCEPILLKTNHLAIGVQPGSEYANATIKISENNRLYLFSDGVFELTKKDGKMIGFLDFLEALKKAVAKGNGDLDDLLKFAEEIQGNKTFQDDYTIVRFEF